MIFMVWFGEKDLLPFGSGENLVSGCYLAHVGEQARVAGSLCGLEQVCLWGQCHARHVQGDAHLVQVHSTPDNFTKALLQLTW
jgi:hypothetical protein